MADTAALATATGPFETWGEMTLRELQREIGKWHAVRWPGTHRDPMYIFTKLIEEAGEVAECLVKRGQDHPKAAEVEAGLPGELLDVFVCLMALCHREGVDLYGLALPHAERLGLKRREIEQSVSGPSAPNGGGS